MHEYALEHVGTLYGSGEELWREYSQRGSTCRHQVRYVPLCECVIWGMICLVRFIMVTSVATGVELLGHVSTVVKIGKLFLLVPIQISPVWGDKGLHLSDFYRHIRAHTAAKDVGGGSNKKRKKERKLNKKRKRCGGDTPHTYYPSLKTAKYTSLHTND